MYSSTTSSTAAKEAFDVDQSIAGPARPSHQFVYSLAELCKVNLPQTNLAILERPEDSAITRYLTTCGTPSWRNVELDIGKDQIDAVDMFLPELPPADSSDDHIGQQALMADIKRLASAYFAISQADGVTVQLSHVDSDMCRLFHADHVNLRLLCTYWGKGTEWLSEADADRAGLGKGCNRKICKNPQNVRHLSIFDVAVLKGSRFPGNQAYGAIHRSPPIVGSDQPWRVMVKIDEWANKPSR